jgi:hypothetical protein
MNNATLRGMREFWSAATEIKREQRRVWGDRLDEMLCDCGRQVVPGSCLCAECERKLYERENAEIAGIGPAHR